MAQDRRLPPARAYHFGQLEFASMRRCRDAVCHCKGASPTADYIPGADAEFNMQPDNFVSYGGAKLVEQRLVAGDLTSITTARTARDDAGFLKHSLAHRTDGDPRIEYLDVVITKWRPNQRKYGS